MSLVFNNPAQSNPETLPGHPSPKQPIEQEKPLNPMEKLKQRKKQQLEKQRLQLDKQIKTLRMARMVARRYVQAQEPDELFTQIRPELTRMKIPLNKVKQDKLKLTEKNVPPKMSLYYVPLRRDTVIDQNIIRSVNSQKKYLNSITWSAEGPELWLWYPYKPPVTEEDTKPHPGMPKAPGTVGVI